MNQNITIRKRRRVLRSELIGMQEFIQWERSKRKASDWLIEVHETSANNG